MILQKTSTFKKFIQSEAGGGIILILSAISALIIANSALAPVYNHVLHFKLAGLSLTHWINDGLMSVFFLLVGLEIKREILIGQLCEWRFRILPLVAAIGGMVVPALIYLAFNRNSPQTINGWAIPVATDIAFALGVIALAGRHVPNALKVFLTALAIMDDLGAVIIIAAFYTSSVSAFYLAIAGLTFVILLVLNQFKVNSLIPYCLLGCTLWYAVFKSGIHPSIAGVALALTIPIKKNTDKQHSSPLHSLEHKIHPIVAYCIVPLFGFANSGLSLKGINASALLGAVPAGIAVGLFMGKQIGVFAFSWIAIKLKIASKPAKCSWAQLYGLSLLCGIGFTMSLFIGGLAFTNPEFQDATKLGVLTGSILSAILGWVVLKIFSTPTQHPLK